MQAYYLFRFKVIESEQKQLFESQYARPEFIRKLISQKPSHESRNGYEWHLGNIREIGDNGLMFAIGRTAKASQEKYDEQSGDFVEANVEIAPFTYALLDLEMSLIGIGMKTQLSPNARGIAQSLERLLNAQPITGENGVRIEIAELRDPENFIEILDRAYAVVEFCVEFTGPNPFDVEKDFHKPMEEYLQATGAEKGSTKVQGSNLDKRSLEKMARSIASTGNQATAKIKRSYKDRPITKHMKGNPMVVQAEDVEHLESAMTFISRMKHLYLSIRKRNSDD